MNTTCRFCNSVLDLAGKCPRCEAIPESPAAPAAGAPATKKRPNWLLGMLIVGGMTVIFSGALAFMLFTRGQRGGRSLAEEPALGYLPSDTNVILAWSPSAT